MKYSIVLLGTVFLMTLPRPAAADFEQIGNRLKGCREITSMLTRVQCYDNAVDDFNLKTFEQQAVGTTPGKWKVVFEDSPITGKQNVYLSLAANDYITNDDGKFIRPSIVLRCMEGRTEGYTAWNVNLGTLDVRVLTRMDQETPTEEKWQLSIDKQGVFLPNPEQFARRLMTLSTFFMKVWPQATNSVQASFDVRGLTTAIQPLAKTCGWTNIPTPPGAAAATTAAPAAATTTPAVTTAAPVATAPAAVVTPPAAPITPAPAPVATPAVPATTPAGH